MVKCIECKKSIDVCNLYSYRGSNAMFFYCKKDGEIFANCKYYESTSLYPDKYLDKCKHCGMAIITLYFYNVNICLICKNIIKDLKYFILASHSDKFNEVIYVDVILHLRRCYYYWIYTKVLDIRSLPDCGLKYNIKELCDKTFGIEDVIK